MSGLEALLTGRILADRYRIEEVIGRGGMGAVYRATDERLGRQVAVKVITLSGAADPDTRERLRQRFLREARAAAGLPHHPNVVPVYDYGTDATLGLDFIVMELLRGEDLASQLAHTGTPPLTTAIHVLREATRGIAVGHRAGLVHRDVKPGNIFLVRDADGELQVRVLDFGIAKLADDDTLTQLTQDGRTPLSPAFASPEQLRGLSRITPASDVFSLGAIAYQLLTGERPFSDADRNRMSLGMPVEVPSPRARNPALPPALDGIVRRALSFHAEERFADAIALGSVLDQARREMGDAPPPPYEYEPRPGRVPPPGVASRGTPAPPQGERTELLDERTEFLDERTRLDPEPAPAAGSAAPARPAAPLPPRRRAPERSGMVAFLVALVVLILFGAGGVFAWWLMNEPGPVAVEETSPPPPELPPIEPEADPLPETPPLALEAAIQNQEGFRLFRQEEYEAASDHFRRAVQMAPDSVTYRYNYGLTLLRLGETRASMREFQRVLGQDPERAGAHFYLGEAQLAQGDTSAAIAAMESARDLASDPRERAVADSRLREVRAAVLRSREPSPQPPPGPDVDLPPGLEAGRTPPVRDSIPDRAVPVPPGRAAPRGPAEPGS